LAQHLTKSTKELKMMQLSYKDIQFTIEAIDHLINTYEKNLDLQDINEDEAADLGNDRMFLESLRHKLAKNLESELAESQPNLSLILQKLSSQELVKTVLELPIDYLR
jgi:FKBP-type peptidyl-prolyl cis-trans isomerase (trigger factor)